MFQIIEAGALPGFVKMLQSESIEEQHAAARVLWTLSFDKTARERIKEEKDCLKTLEVLQVTNK